MTTKKFTKEWFDSLSKPKRQIATKLDSEADFLVLGDAMPFIEEVAPAFGYNIVQVKLQSLDNLRGTPVVKHSEQLGKDYFDYEVEWEKAVESSEKKSLVIFNIDEAEDRLVNALKSIVENHGDKYFVGLISTDTTRDLKHTTTYDLLYKIEFPQEA